MATINWSAPFLAYYWPLTVFVIVTLIVAVALHCIISTSPYPHARSSRRKVATDKRTSSASRHEDPLGEFKDDPNSLSQDSTDLPPPLHHEDTNHISFHGLNFSTEEMIKKSAEYYSFMDKRRSVREFSTKEVPKEVIENIIKVAGTSPSGGHCEPWTFAVVSDPEIKAKIREIVEQEEYINYDRRMSEKWIQDLQFLQTNHEKPYIEEAPYLIIVLKQPFSITPMGHKQPHYYFEISTAIACGFLLTAIHQAGLVTVTTTPMNAGVSIRELLGRPEHEKVMLLLPVGYPAENVKVPDIERKTLNKILAWY